MKSKVSGFTLVELMVVAVIVGLVVLVSSQTPLFSLSFWRKGSEKLKLQRDAHYAILRIQHKLRAASSSNIDASDPSTLLIDAGTDESFFLQENQLFYQDSEGAQEVVIEGDTGTQFNVTSNDGTIYNIVLTLLRGDAGTTLRTAVKPRN